MPRGKAPPSPGCWPAASCRAASRPAVTGRSSPRAGHPADRGRGRGGPARLLGRPGSRRVAGAEPGDPEPGPALRAGAAGAAGLPQVHHGPARAARRAGPGLPSRPPSASSRWMAICWPIPCCNAASARNRVMANKRRQHRAGVFSALAGGVPIGRNHRMVPASGIHVMQHLAQGAAEGRHAQLQPPPGWRPKGRPTRLAPGWLPGSGPVPARRTCVHASTWHRS